MQHSEEVRASEELGARGLKQQGEAGPGTGLSHTVVPSQLCNTHTHTHAMSEEVYKSRSKDRLYFIDQNAVQWEGHLAWKGACQSRLSGAHWLEVPLVCCHWLSSYVYSDTWKGVCMY